MLLVAGAADVRGEDLAGDSEFVIGGTGEWVPVFSWEGAEIRVVVEAGEEGNLTSVPSYPLPGQPGGASGEMDVAVPVWAELHRDLRGRRERGKSPRVLIVGAPDTGKSTLARMLATRAAHDGATPFLVDLDEKYGWLAPTGTVAAATLRTLGDAPPGSRLLGEDGRASFAAGAGTTMRACKGVPSASLRPRAIGALARECGVGECIVDMPGRSAWGARTGVSGALDRTEEVVGVASLFGVDTVVVLGDDELHATLSRAARSGTLPRGREGGRVDVLRFVPSGGAEARGVEARNAARAHRHLMRTVEAPVTTFAPHRVLRAEEHAWANMSMAALASILPPERLEAASREWGHGGVREDTVAEAPRSGLRVGDVVVAVLPWDEGAPSPPSVEEVAARPVAGVYMVSAQAAPGDDDVALTPLYVGTSSGSERLATLLLVGL